MPVVPNPLLQVGPAQSSSRSVGLAADRPGQTPGKHGAGFDQVMTRQQRDSVPARDEVAVQGKPKARSDALAGGNKGNDSDSKVAAGGNDLPADESKGVDQTAEGGEGASVDAALVAGQVTDAQTGAQLLQAQAEAVAPVLQAAAQQPLVTVTAALAEAAADEEPFDPEADALAHLPTLRLALEQNAQAKGTTSAHAAPADDSADAANVNTLANMALPTDGEADAGDAESSGKGFAELLDTGLKDVKQASSDTRVDNFAERLANLTQAVTPKTANAAPVANPLQQPLGMNQGAWTEGLVNRVMYLSSQNLKSANIQLEPAELGRLDIRVNVTAEQATQVTFVSGHAGVRDALDSQLHRLRELFAQQGLAQPDVNVADQSRQQQQQAQQGSSNLSGTAARRAGESGDAVEPGAAGAAQEQQVVIGSSAVDYYA